MEITIDGLFSIAAANNQYIIKPLVDYIDVYPIEQSVTLSGAIVAPIKDNNLIIKVDMGGEQFYYFEPVYQYGALDVLLHPYYSLIHRDREHLSRTISKLFNINIDNYPSMEDVIRDIVNDKPVVDGIYNKVNGVEIVLTVQRYNVALTITLRYVEGTGVSIYTTMPTYKEAGFPPIEVWRFALEHYFYTLL